MLDFIKKNWMIIIITLITFLIPLSIYTSTQSKPQINLTKVTEHKNQNKTHKYHYIYEKYISPLNKPIQKANYDYIEDIVSINKQPMYYIYPKAENHLPKLIIYSHGELQRIIKDKNDEYMEGLIQFGQSFAKEGYAFSASNQHGDNFGKEESLEDIANSTKWFEDNKLEINEKIYMIGFSMGGKATINYALKNPKQIESLVLLAPSHKKNITKKDIDKLKSIPIKIFHGDKDINIPIRFSKKYINIFKNFNKNIELEKIKDADHYDIQFSLKEEIINYFDH